MEIERIPDEAFLYRAIFNVHFDSGRLTSASFSDPYHEPSVDWEKHSSHQETFQRFPNAIFIGPLQAGIPRNEGMPVEHRPSKRNPAHSVIKLDKTNQQQRKQRRFLARSVEANLIPRASAI